MAISAFVARGAVDLSASDYDKTLDRTYDGFRVNVGGDVHFIDEEGGEHTWTLPDGGREAIRLKKIIALGTTATGISVLIR